MSTVLVTGANRGLGRELVRQYHADGWRVFACCRRPEASGLAEGDGLSVHRLDVTDHGGVAALASELEGVAIDVLLNSAGTMGARSFAAEGLGIQRFGESDYVDWLGILRVNVLGPMKMAEAFVEHVARSEQKKIVSLTSIVGSMARNRAGGLYAYRSSKAALNAVMKSMAIDLARRRIIAVAMHPGWVRTEMGGPRAEIDAVTSVAGVRRVIAGLTAEQAGRFLSWEGEELPW
jgi:NAD(P)-dependent dehydrogenase (short-subunit alcohol dehydrogenase family)